MDETGMSCQPNAQRGWSPRGKPHCTDASSSNRRVNVLGALDWGRKKLHYHLHEERACRSDCTQFLDTLARSSDPEKWTFAVMDNASVYHNLDSQTIEDWVLLALIQDMGQGKALGRGQGTARWLWQKIPRQF